MALPIDRHQRQFAGLSSQTDDELESHFSSVLNSIETEEIVHSQEAVEDSLMQQPYNHTLLKTISVLSELSVLKSQPGPLGRLKTLAGQDYLGVTQAEEVCQYLRNDSIAHVVRLLARILAILRNRSDIIVPG